MTVGATFCFQTAVKGGYDTAWLSCDFLVSRGRLSNKKKVNTNLRQKDKAMQTKFVVSNMPTYSKLYIHHKNQCSCFRKTRLLCIFLGKLATCY